MSGSWDRRRAARRADIVLTATGIVVEHGLDALTMPRLAEAMGVAVGGLYRYFPSKDRLLLAMQLESIDRFAAHVDEALEAAGDAEARVRALPRAFLGFVEAEPARYRLLEALIAEPKVLFDDQAMVETQERLEPMLARCAGVLDEAVTAGVLSPGDGWSRLYLLWAALQGVVLFRKQDFRRPESARVANMVRLLEDTLVAGWSR
jgi:TetR/AcrR family transcriptional regulator, cholesterol catabolism regulator